MKYKYKNILYKININKNYEVTVLRIKLAILENDKEYIERLTKVFENKYSNKLQIYAFTNKDSAIKNINDKDIDIFIASEKYDIDKETIPSNCGFAYLVESNDIDVLKEEKTIGKYQMADQIYKQVLGIFSEVNSRIVGMNVNSDSKLKIITVLSAAGGVGASTIASSIAVRKALSNKRVIYVSLEKFTSTDLYFNGDGIMTFSDVIYALKGKNTNIQLKLESVVRRDITGVNYYSGCKNALDMEELNCDDLQRFIENIQMMDKYDYMVIDMGLSFSKECQMVMTYSNSINIISDGTQYSNYKMERAIETIKILDKQHKESVLPKTHILYNRFRTDGSEVLERVDIKTLGGIPVYKYANMQQLIQQIATMEVLDTVI